jgi:hypothetical protein
MLPAAKAAFATLCVAFSAALGAMSCRARAVPLAALGLQYERPLAEDGVQPTGDDMGLAALVVQSRARHAAVLPCITWAAGCRVGVLEGVHVLGSCRVESRGRPGTTAAPTTAAAATVCPRLSCQQQSPSPRGNGGDSSGAAATTAAAASAALRSLRAAPRRCSSWSRRWSSPRRRGRWRQHPAAAAARPEPWACFAGVRISSAPLNQGSGWAYLMGPQDTLMA